MEKFHPDHIVGVADPPLNHEIIEIIYYNNRFQILPEPIPLSEQPERV